MFATTADIAKDMIDTGAPADVAQTYAALSKPCVWLETERAQSEDDLPIGATKFGGAPDLPRDFPWPARAAYVLRDATRNRLETDATAPNSRWSWATAEQCDSFRADARERLAYATRAAPLTFLAQIDFTTIAGAGPLDPDMPSEGVLSLFYDVIQCPWGFDPAERIGFQAHYFVPGAVLARRRPPTEPPIFARQCFSPTAARAHACLTPVPPFWPATAALGLDEAAESAVSDWWSDDDHMYASSDGEDFKCHRIGGWPTPIQGDMQTRCALVAHGFYCGDAKAYKDPAAAPARATAAEWMLLAQIGSDEKPGWMWGDSGQLYVWIRREDLKARRFSEAQLILQCY